MLPRGAVVVLAIVSLLTSTAHSFTRPIALLASPPLSSSAAARQNVKLLQQSSQSSSIAIATNNNDDDEVKIDGRPLINSHDKSFIQRLFSRNNSNTTNNSNNTIRGNNKYGTLNNSTILTPIDAALKVGVAPTRNATKQEWQRAWKIHRYMMKILHKFDECKPTDSKLAL